MTGTIIVTGADLAPQALALLAGFDIVYAGRAPTEPDLVALCRRHDPVAIIVRYGALGAAVMDAAPALKVIAKHGSGTDSIDQAAAGARGIQVVAAVGANAPAVAEHALALLLACAKSVVALDARMHAGHWDKATHKSLELAGRSVGVLGLGAIGRRFARIAHALDMRVLGCDPHAREIPACVQQVDLATLWRESDAISLHCPLTDETRGLLDAAAFAQCRRGVLLVNTARGALIDEAALLAALRSGQVGMAGLDSFALEPLAAGHPFQGQKNIVLSPHIGGVTDRSYVHMGVAAAQNLLAALGREPPVR